MFGITVKLWLAMLTLVVLVLGLAYLLHAGMVERLYYSQREERLLQEGEKLADFIALEDDPYQASRQVEVFSRLMGASVVLVDEKQEVQYWGRTGMTCRGIMGRRMMGGSQRIPFELEKFESVLEGNKEIDRSYNPYFEAEVIVAGIPIKRNGSVAGALFIHLPVAPLATNLKGLQRSAIHALVVGGLLATILSLVLSRFLTGPLRQMNQVARAMADGDFSRRVTVKSGDEVGLLAKSLNKLAQELSEKIEALEKLDQTRREFVATVSHELRSPLTIIQGYTEAILDGMAADEDRRTQYLNNILNESLRLRRLVDDLLDLRRMEAGQVELDIKSLDLGDLVTGAVQRFSLQAGKKNVALHTELDDKLPKVRGDRERLDQAIMNLLDNAIRFTPAGGRVELSVRAEKEGVQLTVSDTGPGMEPEEIPLVWEKFYKSDKSRHRDSGGSGVGLAIVKQVAELHGGSVALESRPGAGSKFTIMIPYDKSK